MVLQDIKLVLYDFDDTLCIHQKRGHTDYDEQDLSHRVYRGDDNLWPNSVPNKHMGLFMKECEELGIKQGLMSLTPMFKQSTAKQKWVEDVYGVRLENYCVGSAEEKLKQMKILARVFGINREQILLIDDKTWTLNQVVISGFKGWSPMQVVNYIEERGNE